MPITLNTNEGLIKVLRGKRSVNLDGIDTVVHQRYRLILGKGNSTPAKAVRSLVNEEFTHGCNCENDCCGHWFGSPNAFGKVKGKKNTYTFVVTSLRNF